MADLLEEQANEIEALQSILMGDMVLVDGAYGISGATHGACYQISVGALGDGEEEDVDDASQTARLGLVFSHTKHYPSTPPLIRCRSMHGLFDNELSEIQDLLVKHAESSVGMAMIFDLVQHAKDWMRLRSGVVDEIHETPEMIQRRLEDEAETRLKAMRAVGTAVTVASFNEWVVRFEQETGIAASAAAAAKANASRATGRKYFEADEVCDDAGDGDDGDAVFGGEFVEEDEETDDSEDSDFEGGE